MQRVFIFIMSWIIIAVIVMAIAVIGFKMIKGAIIDWKKDKEDGRL